jgi:signal transduction histidine kinase
MDTEAHLLQRFARLVAVTNTEEVLRLVADAAVGHVGADAAALVCVADGDRAKVLASRNLPAHVSAWTGDADAIGSDLGATLLELTGGELAHAHVRLVISDGQLFGALVLFEEEEEGFSAEQLALADTLTDVAATVLGKNARMVSLERAHAELRATQRALARSEKLRALGEMASGVSHDLRNVLNPLSMELQVAERALKSGNVESAKGAVADMRAMLQRGLQTIERLRDYARQAPETLTDLIDLDAIAEEALEVAKPRLSKCKVKIPRLTDQLGSPRKVMGNKAEILGAVVNLVINAIDALRDVGGTIVVSTGTEENGTFIRVSDDGPGMSAEIEARAFEPFFTTKGDEGTGLGLAMVYACMQRHAGSVELVTAQGKGTRFTLRFPSQPA